MYTYKTDIIHFLAACLLLPVLLPADTAALQDNPHRKSAYLERIAKHVNSDPNSKWHASETIAGIPSLNTHFYDREKRAAPASVDWRTSGFLRSVGNQGTCGSCWAFASTHAFDDYRSIKANIKQTATSTHRMTSCCKFSGCNGCGGAQPASGFVYLQKKGTVTDTCQPYNLYELKSRPGYCHSTCQDGSRITDSRTSSYRLNQYTKVQVTQTKIREALALGPLVAGIDIYKDFYVYKGGIYHHVKGKYSGRHLIEVVGYGRENNVDYWICKNSWGPEWGENGYFRIAAGDKSGIEQFKAIFAPFSAGTTASSQSSGILVGVNEHSSTDEEDVIEVAKFGAYELNPFCPGKDTDRTDVRNMTLVEVRRAAQKIVSGELITLTATYQELGCPQSTTYEFVVALNTNGEYTLTQSRYVPPENVGNSGFRSEMNWTVLLLLLSALLVLLADYIH